MGETKGTKVALAYKHQGHTALLHTSCKAEMRKDVWSSTQAKENEDNTVELGRRGKASGVEGGTLAIHAATQMPVKGTSCRRLFEKRRNLALFRPSDMANIGN